jgi:RNA polymerase sigma factor (TIGR02999 family)
MLLIARQPQGGSAAHTEPLCLHELVSNVTTILERAAEGETQAAHELLPLVYDELRKLAAARMANEGETSTLQPTALVHEAWLRLVGSQQPHWKNRGHFFAAAAEAMRRILIEHARRKVSLKRGARTERLDLNRVDVAIQADEEALLAMNEALDKFALQDSVSAELVKLRFYVGLNYQEAAQVLGISERSAKRCWSFARAWLFRELSQSRPG